MTTQDLFKRIKATVWPRQFKLEHTMRTVDVPRNRDHEQWTLGVGEELWIEETPEEILDRLMEFLAVERRRKIVEEKEAV